jgi:F420-non-reducing hydrogenase small subunit
MSANPKLSVEWLSVCSGCELGIVDLHEKLLTLLEQVDLVRLPILMDTKEYVAADIGIITGSIRTEHDIESARKMRAACKLIMAFGTCAVYGGPQGAAYAHSNEELFDRAFVSNPTTPASMVPANVPKLLERTLPLDSEIKVDLYMPGCPPHAAYIFEGLVSLLKSRSSKIGRQSVCYRCKRIMKKTDVSTIQRTVDKEYDPSLCFLSQGCLCFGSVTLDRCLAPCMASGVPCFSCGGPTPDIILEPQKDVRSQIALRMAHLTRIPYEEIVRSIEEQAKTHFAYAMASPVFRQKPTFLMKKWMSGAQEALRSTSCHAR